MIRKRRKDYSWPTAGVMQAILYGDCQWKRVKRASKDEALRKVQSARNRVVALLRSAKRAHFFQKFSQCGKNRAKTWHLINSFRGKTSNPPVFKAFSDGAETVADAFNHAFRITSDNTSPLLDSCSLDKSVPSLAFLPCLSKSELRSILFSFRTNKPPGYDEIRVETLCRNFDV